MLLATRFFRPVTLMFSRFLDVKNTRPKVLNLFHVSARLRHAVCTLSYFSSPQSWQSCLNARPSLNIEDVRVVCPANNSTASIYSLLGTLLFCLAEFHSLGFWTGDNIYRCSCCSDIPVSNDFPWLVNYS